MRLPPVIVRLKAAVVQAFTPVEEEEPAAVQPLPPAFVAAEMAAAAAAPAPAWPEIVRGRRYVPQPRWVGHLPLCDLVLEVLDIDREADINATAHTRDHHGVCHLVQAHWLAQYWQAAPDSESGPGRAWLLAPCGGGAGWSGGRV